MELHVFSNIGGTIESALIAPAQKIALSLSGNLVPFVTAGLTIWIIVYGLATIRGAVHTPVNDFVWRVFKISLIVYVGMAGGIFQSDAFSFYSEISNAIYNAISQGSGGTCPVPGNDPMGIYGALDCQAGQMLTPLGNAIGAIGVQLAPPDSNYLSIIGLVLKVIVYLVVCGSMLVVSLLGTLLLLAFMGFEVISLRVTLSLALAVSPIFIFALAFEPIKNMFNNWLHVMLESIVFQALFVVFMGVAFGAVSNIVTGLITTSASDDVATFLITVTVSLISYIILIVILGFTAARIPHLAAKLTSGGAGGGGLGRLLVAAAAGRLSRLGGGGKKSGGEIKGTS